VSDLDPSNTKPKDDSTDRG